MLTGLFKISGVSHVSKIILIFLGKYIQRKWKSLRDSFIREINLQEKESRSGCGGSNRKKYIYFEQLQFLIHRSTNKRNITLTDDDGSKFHPHRDAVATAAENKDAVFDRAKKLSKKRKKLTLANVELKQRTEQISQKEDEVERSDEEQLFLLSLVTEMKKIPEDHRLDARCEIILVIKKWQRLSVK